jgi:hypothetical protein
MSDWKPDKPEAVRAATPAARPAAPAARGASQGPAAAAPRASVAPGSRSSASLDPPPVVRPQPGSTPPLRVGGGSRPTATSASSGRNPNPQVPPAHASGEGVTGKVTHDERGNAVWDWMKNTGRHAVESTSRLLRKLELPELKFEDAKDEKLRIAPDATSSGGYDPYNQATKPGRPGFKK